MNRTIIIVEMLAMAVLIAGLFVGGVAYTGKVIKDVKESGIEIDETRFDYMYTTAICEGNKCRDFEIACLDGEAIRMDPISGLVVLPDDWEDERAEKDKELCGR